MKHRRKCRSCQWEQLKDTRRAGSWLAGVMDGQFQYRWHVRDRKGRALSRELADQERFRYVHPEQWKRWLRDGPCRGCPCEALCDEVCSLRARWWDDRMARLRAMSGMGE